MAEAREEHPAALVELVRRAAPGARLVKVEPLHPDTNDAAATTKGAGYGVPLKLVAEEPGGRRRCLVFHTASPDWFGHDRRADRATEMLLAYDTFGGIARHVPALDVGAVTRDGEGLVSLRDAGEFYMVTGWAEGHVYAEELRRVARTGEAQALDLAHASELARYLVELHREKLDSPPRYVRALRDLLGSGEGIFGIVDGYPDDVPAAPRSRLRAIEQACLEWRWRLQSETARLSVMHGDFHPFNVVFDEREGLAVLDAARGCAGDPADDVTCMAINYVFFAVAAPHAWRTAFRGLWQRFWQLYLDESRDRRLLDVAAPFLAWRGLVVANPAWYPAVTADARDRVLTLIERTLSAPRFDPAFADEVFR